MSALERIWNLKETDQSPWLQKGLFHLSVHLHSSGSMSACLVTTCMCQLQHWEQRTYLAMRLFIFGVWGAGGLGRLKKEAALCRNQKDRREEYLRGVKTSWGYRMSECIMLGSQKK